MNTFLYSSKHERDDSLYVPGVLLEVLPVETALVVSSSAQHAQRPNRENQSGEVPTRDGESEPLHDLPELIGRSYIIEEPSLSA